MFDVPINLVSDTVTRPTQEMRAAMAAAEVGDDVFGEDPTVNALQEYAAAMFGKESALYCPSGTMTNQLAIKVHTKALDEMICDISSHVYQYETSGYAFHSRVGVALVDGTHGKITAEQIQDKIHADHDWLPNSALVVLENSCNKAGGSFYTLDEIRPIRKLCLEYNLKLHLDGARLFNVLVETNESTQEVGKQFDSISICLSKGLGAPVGSLLLGDRSFIKQARKFRKVFGGGMRQAGIIAAGGLYALKHHIPDLKIDNKRAKQIGELLQQASVVSHVEPVHTNIVVFHTKDNADVLLDLLKQKNIHAIALGKQTVRLVFHRDITTDMMDYLYKECANL